MPVGIQTGHSAARLLPRAFAAFLLGNGGRGDWEGLEIHPPSPPPAYHQPGQEESDYIRGRDKSSEMERLDEGTLEPKIVSLRPVNIALEQFQGH